VSVKPQLGLAVGRVRAVAFEAVVRQQREDVAAEVDIVIGGKRAFGDSQDHKEQQARQSDRHAGNPTQMGRVREARFISFACG